MIAALLGCGPPAPIPPSGLGYDVRWSSDPDPLVAGEVGDFALTVLGGDGEPVEDLQRNHERMVHTVFISADLRTFVHAHQEDTRPVTVDDLRAGTFSFPLELPTAGEWLVAFDYAHRNLWLQTLDAVEVAGEPRQADVPDLTGGTTWTDGTHSAALSFDTVPEVGVRSEIAVTLTEVDGERVDDLVQYLGSDGHCVFVSADLAWLTHTHAWFEGMDDMAPSMAMPQVHTGPEVPFRVTFPVAGGWRTWCQFVRGSAPDDVITVTFPIEVAP